MSGTTSGTISGAPAAPINDRRVLLDAGIELINQDGILLDEQRFEEWLDLFVPDCTFWIPMWGTETALNSGTDSALSHIFYDSRKGLEDRVLRIRTGKSPANTPPPRTGHLVSHIAFAGEPRQDTMTLRANWACHILLVRSRTQHVYYGRSEYTLVATPGGWKIKLKKVLLQNDDIRSLLDIYCV